MKEGVLKAMEDRGLCITCWSLCVLEQQDTEWFSSAWRALSARWASGALKLDDYTLTRVYQVHPSLPVESLTRRTL